MFSWTVQAYAKLLKRSVSNRHYVSLCCSGGSSVQQQVIFTSTSIKSISSMSAEFFHHHKRNCYQRRNFSSSKIRDLKTKSRCRSCDISAHWASEHGLDGLLSPTVKWTTDLQSCKTRTGPSSHKNILKFKITLERWEHDETDVLERMTTYFWHSALINDMAPYATIRKYELQVVRQLLLCDWEGIIEPILKQLTQLLYCQYGSGEQKSAKNVILRSIFKPFVSDGSTRIFIHDVVFKGSYNGWWEELWQSTLTYFMAP